LHDQDAHRLAQHLTCFRFTRFMPLNPPFEIDHPYLTPDVGRNCPDSVTLRQAFRRTVNRKTRRSDGTVSLEATRYEIPNRYRRCCAR